MTTPTAVTLALAGLLGISGCEPEDLDTATDIPVPGGEVETTPEPSRVKAQELAEDRVPSDDIPAVQERGGEEAEPMEAGTKQEFVNNVESALQEVNQRIDAWKERGGNLSEDARAQWQEQLNQFQEQRAELRSELERLRESSGDAWRDMRAGVVEAWQDLKAAADSASQHFQ